jgi:hypothetical protein
VQSLLLAGLSKHLVLLLLQRCVLRCCGDVQPAIPRSRGYRGCGVEPDPYN